MKRSLLVGLVLASAACLSLAQETSQSPAGISAGRVIPRSEGYVDANGVLIYYEEIGRGEPLIILHGGPGASHQYFLPYLLPLARRNTLIFIDERGSGRSQRIEDPSGYTVEAMVEDVESVRLALGFHSVSVLGHSYGGVLAQAYALKYQEHLTHLILCSTFHSTRRMNRVFADMKKKMSPELRERIDHFEKAGLFGQGKDYERNRYPAAYMVAAWGEGYFPYLFQSHPDANYDPTNTTDISWDLYREMWGSHGEFVIDGNLTSVEYADRLPSITVPTLITVGDHDECAPELAQEMHDMIRGSKLVILPHSGHMTFVDQPSRFLSAVDDFLHAGR